MAWAIIASSIVTAILIAIAKASIESSLEDIRYELRSLRSEIYELTNGHVDTVPVIRCVRCKFYDPYEKPVEDFDGKCELNVGPTAEVDEDFFCRYGQPKNNLEFRI